MSDSATPEDLEQNLGEARNAPQPYQHDFGDTEVVHMDDPRLMASMNRYPSAIDLGRAIILDREVSDTETILRVKLDPEDPYNALDRRMPGPHIEHSISFAQDRRMPSPQIEHSVAFGQDRRMTTMPSSVAVDSSAVRAPFRTLERRNSSPPRLDSTRTSFVNSSFENVESPRLDNSRNSYVIVDPSTPNAAGRTTSYVIVDPASLDPTRPSYVNVDPSQRDYTRTSYVTVDPSPRPDNVTRPSFINVHRRSSSPPLNDNPRTSYVSPRRVSSPPVVLNSRPGFVNLRRTTSTASPPRVDSARPSLSVFRFKQSAAAANGAAAGANLPPRSPSPGRRATAGDVSSSVLKPTYNSARRSTVLGTVSVEKNRSGSPPLQSPGRRTSTSDVASSGPQAKYYSRRRTTTGDINEVKGLTGRDGKRMSRMPFPGPLGAVVLSWTNMIVKSR